MLPLSCEWVEDGPLAQVEVARESNEGSVTLVLHPGARPVPIALGEDGGNERPDSAPSSSNSPVGPVERQPLARSGVDHGVNSCIL